MQTTVVLKPQFEHFRLEFEDREEFGVYIC